MLPSLSLYKPPEERSFCPVTGVRFTQGQLPRLSQSKDYNFCRDSLPLLLDPNLSFIVTQPRRGHILKKFDVCHIIAHLY